ncbi:Crp/Fnr family transcriptional regulator [Acidovorax sp. LjRoot117]|uniref:Crp/Fnr family transcriptional regulator n=1 Tax=Acidovorax sp. LjRoot117 TaxID=3342255 RepID=UPI003ECD81F5
MTKEQHKYVRSEMFERAYPAGASVCEQGSPSAHWIGVADGILKCESIDVTGRATTLGAVPAGAWAGESWVLKGDPRPYAFVALQDSTVVFVPQSTFLWLLENNPAFSRFVIGQLNERLAHYMALVQISRLNDATGRLAYSLSELFNQELYPGACSRVQMSQEEVGRLSGLARGNTNQALRELQEAGLLRVRYGGIEVLDIDGLRAWSSGEARCPPTRHRTTGMSTLLSLRDRENPASKCLVQNCL